MKDPHESPPPLGGLVTGRYRERGKYSAIRKFGTKDWLLIYTINGAGRFGHECGEVIARPGDIVLIQPGTPHNYGLEKTLRRWDLLWVHFLPRAAWHPWMRWPEEAPGIARITLPKKLRPIVARRFGDVHRLARGASGSGDELAMNALEEVLLRCDKAAPHPGRPQFDERVQRAVDFLCENLSSVITLRALASRIGLSPSRLAHLFTSQAGKSPMQYLEAQRIRRARQLLEFTQKNVAEIAAEVGFESAFYFSLRFKKNTKLSPRLYRKQFAR